MRAAFYSRFGPAAEVLQVGRQPTPRPGPGEVRVRIAFSGVNPSDVKTRAGMSRAMSGAIQIPGSDGSGVIDQVGDGVDGQRIGQRVWLFNAAFRRPGGTSAEYCVVPSTMAQPLPDSVSLQAGACVGIPFVTAHRSLFCDGPIEGQTVLVTGGAGAVGHYAIQLSRWGGAARVIATASNETKAAHARAAGADLVIDYRQGNLADAIAEATSGDGVDRVVEVDLAANLEVSASVIRPGGCIAAYWSSGNDALRYPFVALATKNVALRHVLVYTMSEPARQAAIRDFERWVAAGQAQFALASSFELADVVKAHESVESGTKVGQVLLRIEAD